MFISHIYHLFHAGQKRLYAKLHLAFAWKACEQQRCKEKTKRDEASLFPWQHPQCCCQGCMCENTYIPLIYSISRCEIENCTE